MTNNGHRLNALSSADLFWKNVDRSGNCWLWKGATNAKGYGRVCIDQTFYPAHHVAWFLVMGTWPKESLYRQCPLTGEQVARRSLLIAQGRAKGRDNHCVRPDHMSDGPVGAYRRWSPKAENGFPPEFRKVIPDLMSSEQAETDLMPLLLYRGGVSMGRALALFNWTMVGQAADAVQLGDIAEMSRSWPDAAHAVGLHKPITTTRSIAQFWGRVLDHPDISDSRPGMLDYIRSALSASGVRPIRLEPISRYSPWSTRVWRKTRQAPVGPRLDPMAVWPFLESTPNPEHDLVMAVDKAVPKGIPEVVRQDVCQDLILAILEGTLDVAEVAQHSGKYVKQVFRQYPGKYGPLSLDAPSPWGDDSRTLGETLADAPIILGGQEVDWSAIRQAVAS